MKDTLNKMLNHPIATVIIISGITRGIATIISAVKGNSVQPVVSITNNGSEHKESVSNT